jgi:hypothetical protein
VQGRRSCETFCTQTSKYGDMRQYLRVVNKCLKSSPEPLDEPGCSPWSSRIRRECRIGHVLLALHAATGRSTVFYKSICTMTMPCPWQNGPQSIRTPEHDAGHLRESD